MRYQVESTSHGVIENDAYTLKKAREIVKRHKKLTCKKVEMSFVVPLESGYCYDVWECYKVLEIK